MAAWWKTWRNADHQKQERIHPRGRRTKRLLLEDKEDSVNKFDVFDVVVDHVVGNETLVVS